jgi:Zn-dependent protease with chaperone function
MSYVEIIDQLRFDYENHLFQDLIQQDEIRTWQQATAQQRYFNLHKRHLLGTTVRITNNLFPELDAIYQRCLTYISSGISGQLYIHQSSNYNASAYSHDKQFDILLTSALVKDFKPAEIAFVIGHELGHVLFEHHRIPASTLLFDERSPTLSLVLARRLLQWSRAAEISADRIGFLACGDLSSAANAFFKTASGIQLNDDQRVLKALRTQFDEIKTITSQFQHDQLGVSTHPLIPIRFKSLELISLDLLAFRNSNRSLKTED